MPSIRHSRSPSFGSHSNVSTSNQCKIPHTFSLHTYTRPTVCQYCKKLLRGLFKQGVQCKDCHYNAHKKCIEKIPKDCAGEKENNPVDVNDSLNTERDTFYKDEFDDSDLDDNTSLFNSNNDHIKNNNTY